MSRELDNRSRPGWGWPIAVVVLVHLGLAAIPLHFSEAHSEEPPPIRLTFTAPTPVETPPEPVSEPEPEEVVEAPVEEPVEKPEPAVVAEVPEQVVPEPKVAIAEEEPVVDMPDVVDLPEEPEVAEVVETTEVEESELAAIEPLPTPAEEKPVAPAPNLDEEQPPHKVDWQGYGRTMMQSVQSEQRYPRMAQRRGLEGTATVRVVINRDGTLSRTPDIVDSTSHRSLDREVLRMVEAAAPFAAFPGASDAEEQEFVIPVRFRLKS